MEEMIKYLDYDNMGRFSLCLVLFWEVMRVECFLEVLIIWIEFGGIGNEDVVSIWEIYFIILFRVGL